MTAPRSQETSETTLTQDLFYMARYYLGGRRGLLILAGLVIAAGLALNWSWLVAVGIAPILIAVLPCLAMCALGLCMSRAGGKSCSAAGGHKVGPAPDDVVPSIQSATLRVLEGRSAEELPPLIKDGRPSMNPNSNSQRKGIRPMINAIKALALASAVIASLAVAPALSAHDSEGSTEPMMGSRMMDMMQQMSGMMEGCSKMMQSANPGGSERPDEQGRKDAPQDGKTPGRNG